MTSPSAEDAVDEVVEESFPASDPPSWSPLRARAPAPLTVGATSDPADAPTPRGAGERPSGAASLAASLAAGALAGAAGAAAMLALRPLIERALLPAGVEQESEWERAVRTAAALAGHSLSQTAARGAGVAAHLGYGAAWGAVYGAAQRRLQRPHLLHGALLGGIVYAANFPQWGIMPALGALPPAGERPPRAAAIPVATHAVFGLVTALGYAALARRAPP